MNIKVKFIEPHPYLPIFVFVDEEYNVFVFLIQNKQVLRGFNMQTLFSEDYKLRSIAFFFTENNKNYYENVFLNENKKHVDIPYLTRQYLLFLVVEKSVFVYNIFTRVIVNTITFENMGRKNPLKAEALDDNYIIILCSDGNVLLFSIPEWSVVKIIGKPTTIKAISSFMIIRTLTKENLLILANTNGTMFCLDVKMKNPVENMIKLEFDKLEHDNPILSMDFCAETEMIYSISKNVIFIVNIRDVRISKKMKNFEFFDGNKPYGILCNTDFTSKIIVVF